MGVRPAQEALRDTIEPLVASLGADLVECSVRTSPALWTRALIPIFVAVFDEDRDKVRDEVLDKVFEKD
jgi:hypothetical protein